MAKRIILLIAVAFSLGMVSCDNSKQSKTKDETKQVSSQKKVESESTTTSEPKVEKIPVYMWECHRCGQRVKGIEQPNTRFCPTDTYHSWSRISETGYTTSDATPVYLWVCSRCGELVEGTSMPDTNHCPVDTYHSWNRMSQVE